MTTFFSGLRGWGMGLLLLGGAGQAAGQGLAPVRAYTFSASTAPYPGVQANGFVRDIQQDDNDSRPFPIGFGFPFNGGMYTECIASSNGWLKLGGFSFGSDPQNDLAGAFNQLAPFWDDLNGNMGTASYGVTGTAPNRVFAVQWEHWRWPYNAFVNGGGSSSSIFTITFMVELHETTGVIKYRYRQEAGVPFPTTNLGATIGLAGAPGDFLSLTNASAAPTASRTVSTNTIAQRPATGQVYTFTPPAPCPAPTGVTAVATSATTASVGLVPGAGNATFTVGYGPTVGGMPSSVVATTAPVLLTGLLPSTTYTVSVISTCASGSSSPFTGQLYFTTPAVPNTSAMWTGAAGTAWDVAGNWIPAAVPTATVDVVVPPVANQPTVRGVAACGALRLQAGARLTLAAAAGPAPAAFVSALGTVRLAAGSTLVQAAGTTLDVGGDLTNDGATLLLDPGSTVAFGDDTHVVNGTAPTTLQNLRLSGLGINELQVAAPLRVQRLLTMVQNSFLQVQAGGSLRLLSNAQGTAQVVRDPNCYIAGPVTVERWLLAEDPTGYAGPAGRYVASAVRTAPLAALAAPGFAPVFNPAYNTSATPAATVPFPTVFGFDQSRISTNANGLDDFETGFFSPDAPTDPLALGTGYRLLAPGTTTLAVTGALLNNPALPRTGFTRATLPQSGYHLLGNPYASALDWDSVRLARGTTGLDAAVYTYRPAGPAAGTFAAYVNGVGTGRYLLPGQAFFVRVSAASTPANVTFPHGARYRAYYDPAAPPAAAPDARPLVQLALAGLSGPAAEATAYFQAGATAGFDRLFDAHQLPTAGVPALAFAGAAPLAISGLPALGGADVRLPLAVRVPATGLYTLAAARLRNLPAGTYAYLQDAQTGRAVELGVQPSYSFTMNAAFTGPRFTLLLTRTALATAPAALAAQVLLYPNPARGVAQLELPAALHRQEVTAVVVNAVGQAVRTLMLPATAGLRALALAGLAPGAYTVQVRTAQGTVVKRLLLE